MDDGHRRGGGPPGGLPFSDDERRALARMALLARVSAVGLAVGSVLNTGALIVVRRTGVGGLLGLAVAMGLAALLWRVAEAVRALADRPAPDAESVGRFFRDLRNYFVARSVVYLGTTALACIGGACVVMILALFGAALSLLPITGG